MCCLKVSELYGMLFKEDKTSQTVRAVFILSPDMLIAAIIFYPYWLGRSVDDLLQVSGLLPLYRMRYLARV